MVKGSARRMSKYSTTADDEKTVRILAPSYCIWSNCKLYLSGKVVREQHIIVVQYLVTDRQKKTEEIKCSLYFCSCTRKVFCRLKSWKHHLAMTKEYQTRVWVALFIFHIIFPAFHQTPDRIKLEEMGIGRDHRTRGRKHDKRVGKLFRSLSASTWSFDRIRLWLGKELPELGYPNEESVSSFLVRSQGPQKRDSARS